MWFCLGAAAVVLCLWASRPPRPVEVQLVGREGQIWLLPDHTYFPTLLRLLRGARREIWIGMYAFKADPYRHHPVRRVVEALREARRRGVRVRVLLDDEGDLNRSAYRMLKRAGVEVRWDSPRVRTHLKVVLVDGRWLLVGSHNLTASAFRYNHELSVLLNSPQLASQAHRYLKEIWDST